VEEVLLVETVDPNFDVYPLDEGGGVLDLHGFLWQLNFYLDQEATEY
jgi:hypothetical protein